MGLLAEIKEGEFVGTITSTAEVRRDTASARRPRLVGTLWRLADPKSVWPLGRTWTARRSTDLTGLLAVDAPGRLYTGFGRGVGRGRPSRTVGFRSPARIDLDRIEGRSGVCRLTRHPAQGLRFPLPAGNEPDAGMTLPETWHFPYSTSLGLLRWLHAASGARRLCWGSDYPVVTSSMAYHQFAGGRPIPMRFHDERRLGLGPGQDHARPSGIKVSGGMRLSRRLR
jgi:hypothetical protein